MAKKTIKGVKEGCYFLGIDTRTGKVVNAENHYPILLLEHWRLKWRLFRSFLELSPRNKKLPLFPKSELSIKNM